MKKLLALFLFLPSLVLAQEIIFPLQKNPAYQGAMFNVTHVTMAFPTKKPNDYSVNIHLYISPAFMTQPINEARILVGNTLR